jgi:ABC-type antimicrobial peptide transport system permease subunit
VLDVVHGLDASLAATRVRTLEDHVSASRSDQRFRAVLLGLFAGASFVLAIVGLYAVVAYSTNRRRHEIGVRIALGAGARDIEALVLSEGMRPVFAGLVVGCGLAVAMSRVMTGLLFGVRPVEPSILAGVCALLAAAAAAACYLPARRAATADPRETLRAE